MLLLRRKIPQLEHGAPLKTDGVHRERTSPDSHEVKATFDPPGPQLAAVPQRPTVLAFYIGGGSLKFWTDFDWDIVTHLVIFGIADKEMMAHAHSKGAKVLSGISFARDMVNTTVRHGLTNHALSLSYHHPPFDGIFVRCPRRSVLITFLFAD